MIIDYKICRRSAEQEIITIIVALSEDKLRKPHSMDAFIEQQSLSWIFSTDDSLQNPEDILLMGPVN